MKTPMIKKKKAEIFQIIESVGGHNSNEDITSEDLSDEGSDNINIVESLGKRIKDELKLVYQDDYIISSSRDMVDSLVDSKLIKYVFVFDRCDIGSFKFKYEPNSKTGPGSIDF